MIQFRIANLIGLDINNAQHSVAIDEALIGIDDTESFYEYMRDKKDGIEYATKPEKLISLSHSYKKLQNEALLPHTTAKNFSVQLSEKVESARVFLKNEIEIGNDKPFSRLKVDGDSYFTEKELAALSEIGTSRYLIELAERDELRNKLIDLFLSKFQAKAKYETLTNNQKKVKALIGGER